MPELPEVETIRRRLETELVGRSIQNLRVLRRDLISQPSAQTFRRLILGQAFNRLGRRGKYLLFRLTSGKVLIIHLGMSGVLYLKSPGDPLLKHTHLRLFLDDGRELRYVDPRRFGRIMLVSDLDETLSDLGPEPLGNGFSPEVLANLLARRKGMLKPLLMNQRVIAGLGNIYVDESLFLARLHPRRRADTLRSKDVDRLYLAIGQALNEGLEDSGSSIDYAYRLPDESLGEHQDRFRVFQRTGEPCPRCGTPIARTVLSGRSTHFCPHCQK